MVALVTIDNIRSLVDIALADLCLKDERYKAVVIDDVKWDDDGTQTSTMSPVAIERNDVNHFTVIVFNRFNGIEHTNLTAQSLYCLFLSVLGACVGDIPLSNSNIIVDTILAHSDMHRVKYGSEWLKKVEDWTRSADITRPMWDTIVMALRLTCEEFDLRLPPGYHVIINDDDKCIVEESSRTIALPRKCFTDDKQKVYLDRLIWATVFSVSCIGARKADGIESMKSMYQLKRSKIDRCKWYECSRETWDLDGVLLEEQLKKKLQQRWCW